ncbi:MAG: hypothetical protein AAGI30_10595 [Planctomycetota bacterium]
MTADVQAAVPPGSARVAGLGRWLRWAGLALVVVPALVRTLMNEPRLPYWDLSPFEVDLPETTLLPSMAFALDALALVGVALIVTTAPRIRWATGVLLLAGGVAILVHGLVFRPFGAAADIAGSLGNMRVGSAWLAALASAWALTHLDPRQPSPRALWTAAVASVLAIATVHVARGVHDYTVQHDSTVAEYRKDREQSLRAQGLELGSSQALAFERRLMQREAVGWFGLSNVYASVVGACAVGFGVLAVLARRGPPKPRVILGVAGAACALALWMTHSKGGTAMTLFGGGLAMLIAWLAGSTLDKAAGGTLFDRLRSRAHWLALAAIALPLVAVVARGLIGERLTELSLLFRWHYLVASSRIMAEYPLLGVGPDGFQKAYVVHKVPINPEDVASPHSVLFDWIATLGVGGVALAVMLAVWAVWVGRSAGSRPRLVGHEDERAGTTGGPDTSRGRTPADRHVDDSLDPATPRRFALLALLAACGMAILRQSPTSSPDLLVFVALGLIAALAVAWAIAELARTHLGVVQLALAAAALVLIAHAQIEMTPVRAQSSSWVLAVIGLAAAPSLPRASVRRVPQGVAGAVVALCAVVSAVAATRALTWEHHLARAATMARVFGVMRTIEASGGVDRSVITEFLSRPRVVGVLEEIGSPLELYVEPSMHRARALFIETELDRAARVMPGTDLARRRLIELYSFFPHLHGEQTAERAVAAAERAASTSGASTAWLRAAEVFARSGLSGSDDAAEAMYQEAIARAPYAVRPPATLARFLATHPGRADDAAEAARQALRNNDLLRLDPLVQLDDRTRRRLERISGAAPDPGDTE